MEGLLRYTAVGVVPAFYLGHHKGQELCYLEKFLMCTWKCSVLSLSVITVFYFNIHQLRKLYLWISFGCWKGVSNILAVECLKLVISEGGFH